MSGFRSKNTFRLKGGRGSALDLARGRIVIISAVFVVAYIVVAARVVDLSIIQGNFHKSDVNTYVNEPIEVSDSEVKRADITDRNGVLLARSLTTASLYADPKLIENPKQLARDVTRVLPDLKYGDVLKKAQGDGRFVWLKRNLTPEEHQNLLYLGYPGLGFQAEDRRIYPQGNLTSHIVGYTSVDGVGLSGVESSFNALLGDGEKPLALTLDVRLQHALRRELSKAVKTFRADGAAGVVMDVRSGDVLASVSLPDFDPHDFTGAKSQQKFNKVTLGAYELGSVMKVASIAAYIDSYQKPFNHSFDARKPLKRRGSAPIRDYHAQKRILTLPEVFVHSSNIGTALMAEKIGTDALKGYYKSFGFIGKSTLEIPEVATTRFHTPWQEVDTLSASFGHAIAVTPLQMTSAIASLVAGGEKIDPTIILNETNPESAAMAVHERIVSPQTADSIRKLMRLNVVAGTGGNAAVPGLRVGGKTGTAEKAGAGGYDRDKLLSSFVGAFPMDDPKYAVFVMIDEPKGTKETYGYATAGWVAAPVVAKIIASMGMLLGLEQVADANDTLADPLRVYVKTKEQIKAEGRHENAL